MRRPECGGRRRQGRQETPVPGAHPAPAHQPKSGWHSPNMQYHAPLSRQFGQWHRSPDDRPMPQAPHSPSDFWFPGRDSIRRLYASSAATSRIARLARLAAVSRDLRFMQCAGMRRHKSGARASDMPAAPRIERPASQPASRPAALSLPASRLIAPCRPRGVAEDDRLPAVRPRPRGEPARHAVLLRPVQGKAAKEASARTHRVRCRECGSAFQAPRRTVRYCSAPCRKKGCKARRSQTGSGRARDGAAECRECGGPFAAGTRPGSRVYCSAACRANGTRAWMRNYMLRYLADPKKSALHSARAAAAQARHRAAAARDRTWRVRCRMCGGEFSAPSGNVRYCSDPCREKGYRRVRKACDRRRRELERERAAKAPAAAK